MLYLVPTPIGNLGDITLRAIEVLKEADVIACEDTRHSLRLLNHLEIRKPLVSYHEHNEARRTAELIERLRAGADGRPHYRCRNARHLRSGTPAAAGMHRGRNRLHGAAGAFRRTDGAGRLRFPGGELLLWRVSPGEERPAGAGIDARGGPRRDIRLF